MAWTRQTRAARLIARFQGAVQSMLLAQQTLDKEPTQENVQNKIDAERRFNILCGTMYKVVINSTEEL